MSNDAHGMDSDAQFLSGNFSLFEYSRMKKLVDKKKEALKQKREKEWRCHVGLIDMLYYSCC